MFNSMFITIFIVYAIGILVSIAIQHTIAIKTKELKTYSLTYTDILIGQILILFSWLYTVLLIGYLFYRKLCEFEEEESL